MAHIYKYKDSNSRGFYYGFQGPQTPNPTQKVHSPSFNNLFY